MSSQKFNPLSGQFDLVLDKASEINYDNTTSGLTATEVQAAIDEIDNIIDTLPDPITYAGTWDASTNTPTLDNSDTGVTGFLYRVTVAGTVDFGAGNISFDIGDSVVNNGTIWEKWDHSDQVLSVNAQTGAVVLDTDDISEGATNLYYTDSRAQGAITGGASSIVTANLSNDLALVSNASGKVAVSAVTATELGYVSGVTSAIQTQLGDKASTTLNNLVAPTAANQDVNAVDKSFGLTSAATGPGYPEALQGYRWLSEQPFLDAMAEIGAERQAGPGALTDVVVKVTDSLGAPTLLEAARFKNSSGNLSMNSHKIEDVTDPTAAQDAATKNYVDTRPTPTVQVLTSGTTYTTPADCRAIKVRAVGGGGGGAGGGSGGGTGGTGGVTTFDTLTANGGAGGSPGGGGGGGSASGGDVNFAGGTSWAYSNVGAPNQYGAPGAAGPYGGNGTGGSNGGGVGGNAYANSGAGGGGAGGTATDIAGGGGGAGGYLEKHISAPAASYSYAIGALGAGGAAGTGGGVGGDGGSGIIIVEEYY
jgi:hypothetical protein